jgi:2-C-methyl-D-erythritol 2,4-cyclodiphosphate synthase
MRIGIGYDIHKLVAGRKLIIGGVEISYERGLMGHSDADVLLHAIIDALLGAAGLGDIGRHFPAGDPEYKDISSLILLDKTRELISKAGYRPINVDSTIVAQKPKMAPYIGRMRDNISQRLGISMDRVSVKATTNEELGAIGREEGIAAIAVVLIE